MESSKAQEEDLLGSAARDGGGAASSLLLDELDNNVLACVMVHLSPSDLARVGQTCRALAREAESDVTWCTLFLRRFGSDFWGESVGHHPYHSVPEEINEWLHHPITDIYARYPSRPTPSCRGEPEERGGGTDWHASALQDFVKRHDTSQGYGGWKQAYHRMHEMEEAWHKPSPYGIIVAGLPDFATLSCVADLIKRALARGLFSFYGTNTPKQEDEKEGKRPSAETFDLVSPGGECRLLRREVNYYYNSTPAKHTANVCVIRKPRNWCGGRGKRFFRGFSPTSPEEGVKFVYVVDAGKMDADESYQEQAYRELHGMLGEGKGKLEEGLFLMLFLLNATDGDHQTRVLNRLKIPPFAKPSHNCPYYAGPVVFIAGRFTLPTPGEPYVDVRKVAQGLTWLHVQPSTRPHWESWNNFLLCALSS